MEDFSKEIQLRDENEDHSIGSPEWGKSSFWLYRELKVHFRVVGDYSNPAVVLIHGFGASCDHWRNNAKSIASNGFLVYGIDLIGFGKSAQNNQGKTIYLNNVFWSSQIISFIDEIVALKKNEKVVLIGNSLGALVAITTLSKRPDLIKAVVAAPLPEPVFVNPIKTLLPNWFKKPKRFLIKLFFNLFPIKALINLISKTKLITFALQSAYFRPIQNDNLLKRIVTVPARRTYASKALRAMCIGMSIRSIEEIGPSILSRIKNLSNRPPILLIWGKQDKLIPLFLAQKLIKLHPWLKLKVIADAGHCPHDELPDHFNQIVLKWLKNLKTSK